VDAEHRPRALSITNAAATVATIAGPILGGPIVTRFGTTASFVGLGVLVALGLLWALVEPGGTADVGRHEEEQSPFESLRRAARPGRRQMAYLSIAFVALMSSALQLLGPLHLDAEGLSSAAIGWVFTAGAVLAVLAIVAVARLGRRLDHVMTLVLLPLACAVGVALMALPIGVSPYILLLDGMIFLAAPIYTIAYASCAEGAHDEGIGEGGAFGMLNAIWAGGSVLAPVLAGFLSQHGPSWAMYAVVVASALVAAVVLRRSIAPARRQMLGGAAA
jgi:MFS family permease